MTKSGKRCKRSSKTGSKYCSTHSSGHTGTDLTELHAEYQRLRPVAIRFASTFVAQLESLLELQEIALGVPVEHRVKDWRSISEKMERKSLSMNSLLKLDDLIGIRLILLFKRDLEKVHETINREFNVLAYDDTSTRLEETQFGYQSVHYQLALPEEWLKVPTMAEFSNYRTELQLRTLSQHIWAAASHKLQYKNESNVPPPLRRSIHRVSAILETVDLEFERLLEQRETYIEEFNVLLDESILNTESLRQVLVQKYPESNKSGDENYSSLLTDLQAFEITTVGGLVVLIDETLKDTMKREAAAVAINRKLMNDGEEMDEVDASRTNLGVYYTLAGLVRISLAESFGKQWNDYIRAKFERRMTNSDSIVG